MIRCAAVALSAWLFAAAAQAHPLAPALLELREIEADRYEVLWRTSVARVRGTALAPQLPAECREVGAASVTTEENQSLVRRWQVACPPGGLRGKLLGVAGLEQSPINVILRLQPLGSDVMTTLLDAGQPVYIVTDPQARPVATSYLALGVKHLLLGFDHVLFVLGLVLLLRRPAAGGAAPGLGRLFWTITAFTLGHSITLALATVGLLQLNQSVTELGIALSILALACELAAGDRRPGLLARKPALMALAFGLLHGLGFAGVLADVGLPRSDIPLALLSFNLGIELGQLLLVLALLPALALWRRLAAGHARAPLRHAQALPVYFIGALAALWCLERAAELSF